ncbi:hypothetical protein WMY93_005188 [Mugilogobius chulae]|uniref:Transmembrane protein n=1 Tax=Mugilogobius chulae TaxID=88201 RepID=A0AAW0PQE3_9GOBI
MLSAFVSSSSSSSSSFFFFVNLLLRQSSSSSIFFFSSSSFLRQSSSSSSVFFFISLHFLQSSSSVFFFVNLRQSSSSSVFFFISLLFRQSSSSSLFFFISSSSSSVFFFISLLFFSLLQSSSSVFFFVSLLLLRHSSSLSVFFFVSLPQSSSSVFFFCLFLHIMICQEDLLESADALSLSCLDHLVVRRHSCRTVQLPPLAFRQAEQVYFERTPEQNTVTVPPRPTTLPLLPPIINITSADSSSSVRQMSLCRDSLLSLYVPHGTEQLKGLELYMHAPHACMAPDCPSRPVYRPVVFQGRLRCSLRGTETERERERGKMGEDIEWMLDVRKSIEQL